MRWKKIDKVFGVMILLVIFYAWMDAKQIIPFRQINTESMWNLYNTYTGPAIWSLWLVVIGAIALIWYIIKKDKSEAVALFVGAYSLMFFGTQDLFYFLFSGLKMEPLMCWCKIYPVNVISNLMGSTCATPTAFILSGIIGTFISYHSYKYFKEAKW